jgi:hypothetical protein
MEFDGRLMVVPHVVCLVLSVGRDLPPVVAWSSAHLRGPEWSVLPS